MTNHDTNPDTSNNAADQVCGEWQPLLMLSAAGGELEPAEQARLTAHLAGCPSCATALDSEREILAILVGRRREPEANLLASCRLNLDDALDHEEEHGWLRRFFGMRLP